MIKKVVNIIKLSESNSIMDDLEYWLKKTYEERISAVEFLRRQHDGSSERLQRVVRVIPLVEK
jgi:regulator of PEP synthase PpsR (kinase-PPPase family)